MKLPIHVCTLEPAAYAFYPVNAAANLPPICIALPVLYFTTKSLHVKPQRSSVPAVMPVAARPLSGTRLATSVQSRCAKLDSRPTRRCRQHRQGLRVQAAKTADGPSVAIVGVTGAVGQEFLRVSLELRHYGSQHCLQRGICDNYSQHCTVCSTPDLTRLFASCLQVLKERDFPYSSLKMLASGRYCLS